MGETTGISWTSRTFNPWIGCTKVSPGCAHCFAEQIVEVFPMGKGKGAFRRLELTKTWGAPAKWNDEAAAAGRRELVFMGSMLDFFHEGGDEWRPAVWELVKKTPNLEYQILTKRPERIRECLPPDWGDTGYGNVWLGTSVENQKYAELRIPELLDVPAKLHFLSCEPLLGPLDLWRYLGHSHFGGEGLVEGGVGWTIVGGESGAEHRQMMTQWAIDIKAQCDAAEVPFFGKQRSGPKNEIPLIMNGREWKAFPLGFERGKQGPVIGAGQQVLAGV